MDAKHFLKNHAYLNTPLGFDEAYSLGIAALRGCGGDQLDQIQSVAVLCALHSQATYAWKWTKAAADAHAHALPDSAAEQIAGVCAAVYEHDIIVSEFGCLRPDVEYAIDNCGMGGDMIVTANVSTLAAFIAAAAGIPMCKHGSPANADQGRHGSSDFVASLGIDTYAGRAKVEACLAKERFGYTEALDSRFKRIHLQTHLVAKLPHMNDIIGPITNPLHPSLQTRKILGLNHLVPPRVAAEAYLELNKRGFADLKHGLFIRGFADETPLRGMDELSICAGGTQVAELKDGQVSEYRLHAEDFGLDPVGAESISPPDGMSKGDFSRAILEGKIGGAPLQMVLANAALIFWLAGRSHDLKECYRLASEIHASGADLRKVRAVSAILA